MANIEIKGLAVSYKKSEFKIGPITETIHPGVTALLGSNGAGKSTLIRALVGLQKLDIGEIQRPKNVGYLAQDFNAPMRAKVVDYLTYVAWLQGVKRGARQSKVDESLSTVGLHKKKESTIGDLSGGMRRRLGIAQAIIHSPELVVLDEPTAGLDLEQRISVSQAIRSISSNSNVLVSTHQLDDVVRFSDRVILIESGNIKYSGAIEDVKNKFSSNYEKIDLKALAALEDLLEQ